MAEKTATGDEAAAIAAAIARFESEFAAVPATEPRDAIGPWQRAALLEGVGAKQNIQDPQAPGGARWQS
ncbi:MAG TPA: hypothetical protein VFN82_04105 [Solirubrobacterales bacterium]|nr:hypothetical protein [Solirubrobacterales bacterium]